MAGEPKNPPAFDIGFEDQPPPLHKPLMDSAAEAVDTFHTILQTRIKTCIAYARMHKATLDSCIQKAIQDTINEATRGKNQLDGSLRQEIGNAVSSAWEYAASLGVTPSISPASGGFSPQDSLDTPQLSNVGGQMATSGQAGVLPSIGQSTGNTPLSVPNIGTAGGVSANGNLWVLADCEHMAIAIYDHNAPDWRAFIYYGKMVPIRTDFGNNVNAVDYWIQNHDSNMCVQIAKYARDNHGEGWPPNGDFSVVDRNGNVSLDNPPDQTHGFPPGPWPFDKDNNWKG